MIKLCGLPGCGVVTQIASLRKSLRDVVRIRRALEILEVARHACVGGQVVIVVRVAIGAGSRRNRVHPRQREVDARMVKGCRRPASRRMTCVAGGREIQRHMARICRALEIGKVATDAGRIS